MPYNDLENLPENVRDNLPHHTQEIYRAANNNAWDQYDYDESRAHRVAWGAVERDYENDDSGR